MEREKLELDKEEQNFDQHVSQMCHFSIQMKMLAPLFQLALNINNYTFSLKKNISFDNEKKKLDPNSGKGTRTCVFCMTKSK